MRYDKEYWNDVSSIISQIPNIEKLYGKKILITGATGMVCSAVVDIIIWLNKMFTANIKVILAGRSHERITNRFAGVLREEDFTYIEFDSTKFQEYNISVDYIIHGASNANPAAYLKEPVETIIGNVIGLQSLLELARKNHGSRMLFISSSEVYGNRQGENADAFKEEDYGYVDILNPRACYPNGKRAAETLCVSYSQEYNVDTVIVRPGHIYGPTITKTDNRASAEFTKNVVECKNIVMKSAGTQLRSYCYMLDCASAIITVLLNGKRENAYNISNKKTVISIYEMAEELARQGGVKVIYENPSDAEQRSYNLMDNSSLNADKLEELGWNALFDLHEGVKKTILFY